MGVHGRNDVSVERATVGSTKVRAGMFSPAANPVSEATIEHVEHGGPVRMITPQLYAWKGAKWISRIEFMIGDRKGFWEQRGYSDTAYPWRNDRYG